MMKTIFFPEKCCCAAVPGGCENSFARGVERRRKTNFPPARRNFSHFFLSHSRLMFKVIRDITQERLRTSHMLPWHTWFTQQQHKSEKVHMHDRETTERRSPKRTNYVSMSSSSLVVVGIRIQHVRRFRLFGSSQSRRQPVTTRL